jgi:hypothetical protein
MPQAGIVRGVVLAYISGFSAITAMEVPVWLQTLLCLNNKSVARIWEGCPQVNPEILDDPCCLPNVAAATAWAEADTSWLLQCDWVRRTVWFVRLMLKVVTENHAVFVELPEVYKNYCRMCKVTQVNDDWNRLVTQSQHTLTGMTDRGRACSSAVQTSDTQGDCDFPGNSPWSQTHCVLCCQLIQCAGVSMLQSVLVDPTDTTFRHSGYFTYHQV